MKGLKPSPRAAHAATSVESSQIVIYGGANGNGTLAREDLFLFDMKKGEEYSNWLIVPTSGPNPGKRYGHSINFVKPNLVIFGGNSGDEMLNDVWILSIEITPFSWQKLDFKSEVPSPRQYHSASECLSGNAAGMIIVFGGRTVEKSNENDLWGLRKHRDGKWEWVKAISKSKENIQPAGRHKVILIIGFSIRHYLQTQLY